MSFKKAKQFCCKKCHKLTSTTNEKIYKLRICGACRLKALK